MNNEKNVISRDTKLENDNYKWGFDFKFNPDNAPLGLSEDIVKLISEKKKEPKWLLDWRLKSLNHWFKNQDNEPEWANIDFPKIDFQKIRYYSSPTSKPNPKSLDEVDPEMLEAFTKLGIPLEEQKKLSGVAVDAIMDSVSVATTYQKQ